MDNSKKIAVAVAMLCTAGTTLAQEINPSWYVQPNVARVEVDREFLDEKDWGGGVKFGKPLSKSWDIQILASYLKASSGPTDYHQYLLGADALLMLSRQRWRPFLLFGVGLQRDKIENQLRDEAATNPYVTAGIGFQYTLNERWSMQADIRSVRGYLDREDKLGPTRTNNKYLTVGVNYAFNPPPKPYVPPPPPPEPVVEAPPPPPPPPAPPPPAKFEKITLKATELFAFNSARLTMPQPALDDVVAALTADTSVTDIDIDIVGYTDRIGSDKYNLKLSQRRADAVRDYLVSKGIDAKRLQAHGKGKANPVVQCHQKKRAELIKCLEPNRRVEIEQITIERRVE